MKKRMDYAEVGGSPFLGLNRRSSRPRLVQRQGRQKRDRAGGGLCQVRFCRGGRRDIEFMKRVDRKMEELEKIIGYSFKDKKLLRQALTHSSYANEHGGREMCNERLEFLGDALLGFVCAEKLYKIYKDQPGGS